MSTEQWNQYGYCVIFYKEFVYLVRVGLNVGYVTAVNNGEWMLFPNVNRAPWRFLDLTKYPEVLNLAAISVAERDVE